MTDSAPPASPARPAAPPSPVDALLGLIRRGRTAESAVALRFIAVNDTHLIAPYHQSVLWLDRRVAALSGLVEIESNAPFVQFLEGLRAHLAGAPARMLSAADLPPSLAEEWSRWLPAHGLYVPAGRPGEAALLYARDLPWRELELRVFQEWLETWACLHRGLSRPGLASRAASALRRAPRALLRRPLLWSAALIALLLVPVRLSVLAPGELVPAAPVAVRAPLEGVIAAVHVRTNQVVAAGQPLFSYDDALLAGKLEVALEALRTAEAEERQFSQQALHDQRARAALAAARGQVQEKRAEVDYLRAQLARGTVLAPRAGVAFVGDPSEWVGRPVAAGQRILRIADPADREVEAWLPLGDAIRLEEGAEVKLYLSSSPLDPVSARVRFVSYEALRRPDGAFAYRVRAGLDSPSEQRVGLKGTARLSGDRVPFVYWMLRRPLAAAREFLGL